MCDISASGTSKEACQATCPPTPTAKYICQTIASNKTKNCIVVAPTVSGATTLDECQKKCIQTYKCDKSNLQNYQCKKDLSTSAIPLEQCQINCFVGYKCDQTSNPPSCVIDSQSTIDLSTCHNTCNKWSCNWAPGSAGQAAGSCSPDKTGVSRSTCEGDCFASFECSYNTGTCTSVPYRALPLSTCSSSCNKGYSCNTSIGICEPNPSSTTDEADCKKKCGCAVVDSSFTYCNFTKKKCFKPTPSQSQQTKLIQCRNDNSCNSGEFCDPNMLVCGINTDNSCSPQCSVHTYCSHYFNKCALGQGYSNYKTCEVDNDCINPSVCDKDTNWCIVLRKDSTCTY